MSDLYDTDAVHLGRTSRRRYCADIAAGERVNDQVDWENVIEEIEDVGGRERDKVTEALMQAMRHKLYLIGWPHSAAVRHWEAEVRIHLATATAPIPQQHAPIHDAGELAGGLSERAATRPPAIWRTSGRRLWLCRATAPGHWTSCSPRGRPRSGGVDE